MAKLPVVKGDDAIKAFGRAGFSLDHWRGGHVILYHPDGRHLSVPGGRKELKAGTLRTLTAKLALQLMSLQSFFKSFIVYRFQLYK